MLSLNGGLLVHRGEAEGGRKTEGASLWQLGMPGAWCSASAGGTVRRATLRFGKLPGSGDRLVDSMAVGCWGRVAVRGAFGQDQEAMAWGPFVRLQSASGYMTHRNAMGLLESWKDSWVKRHCLDSWVN